MPGNYRVSPELSDKSALLYVFGNASTSKLVWARDLWYRCYILSVGL